MDRLGGDFRTAYSKFDRVLFGTVCRQLEVRIVMGNKEAALRLFKDYLENTDRKVATMESALHDVLDPRTVNTLFGAEIKNLAQLDQTSNLELEEIDSVSFVTIRRIRETIKEIKAGKFMESYGTECEHLCFDHEIDTESQQ